MGLFDSLGLYDSTPKQLGFAEKELKQKLASVPLVDLMIRSALEENDMASADKATDDEDYALPLTGQSFFDQNQQSVKVELTIATARKKKDKSWLFIGQDYYDSCKRTVTIEPDLFEIKWTRLREEPFTGSDGKKYVNSFTEVLERIAFRFTESGYAPLHTYLYDNGRECLSISHVCSILASIIGERMKEQMPKCNFNTDVIEYTNESKASFDYSVPKRSYIEWF